MDSGIPDVYAAARNLSYAAPAVVNLRHVLESRGLLSTVTSGQTCHCPAPSTKTVRVTRGNHDAGPLDMGEPSG